MTLQPTTTTSSLCRYLSFILFSFSHFVREGSSRPACSDAVDQCMTAWSPIGVEMKVTQEHSDHIL